MGKCKGNLCIFFFKMILVNQMVEMGLVRGELIWSFGVFVRYSLVLN